MVVLTEINVIPNPFLAWETFPSKKLTQCLCMLLFMRSFIPSYPSLMYITAKT